MSKKDEINEFILPVFIKKKKHDFNAWLCLRKTLRRMDSISPDFDTLYKIWQMVNSFYICYMHTYHQDTKLHLFLATTSKNMSNAYAMIYQEDNFSIKFVLQLTTDRKIINLEIDRTLDTKNSQPERISFEDGNYSCKDNIDNEKFLFITSCLMNGAKELIRYYYKNKRF